ncbi:MAG: alpha/beta hydrolase [Bryobacteraceae bacterium]
MDASTIVPPGTVATARILRSLVFLIGAAILPGLSLAQMDSDGIHWHPPAPGENNVWFAAPNLSTDTVFVFVHGLNSDSRCWLYEENGQPKQYWPYLVWMDERLHRPSVFMAGYRFGTHYTIINAVDDILDSLNDKNALAYPNIVFVAHSMGGIVVRRMLVDYSDRFRHKKLGVLLFASPSGGSHFADMAGSILSFLQLPQSTAVDRLRTNNPYLVELDQEFKDLLDGHNHNQADRLDIAGAEVLEGDNYVGGMQVVDPPSASRYFSYRTLPGDHSSIVKPPTADSPSHQFLVEFYHKYIEQASSQPLVSPALPAIQIKPVPVEMATPPLPPASLPGRDQTWQHFSPRSDDEIKNEIWSFVQAWKSSIEIGDWRALRNFYADRLDRFFGRYNMAADEALQILAEANKYRDRSLALSKQSFLSVTSTEAEVEFEKRYSFSGPYVTTNQGLVKSRLGLARVMGEWKIKSQYDQQICWTSISSNAYDRIPKACE